MCLLSGGIKKKYRFVALLIKFYQSLHDVKATVAKKCQTRKILKYTDINWKNTDINWKNTDINLKMQTWFKKCRLKLKNADIYNSKNADKNWKMQT